MIWSWAECSGGEPDSMARADAAMPRRATEPPAIPLEHGMAESMFAPPGCRGGTSLLRIRIADGPRSRGGLTEECPSRSTTRDKQPGTFFLKNKRSGQTELKSLKDRGGRTGSGSGYSWTMFGRSIPTARAPARLKLAYKRFDACEGVHAAACEWGQNAGFA
jgi:hypothetical protein